MTHLRNLMLEELERRNYSQSTARAYLMTVKDFARYFRQPPDTLGPEHIRQYQAYLFRERKLASNSVNQRLGALRFFFIKTLKKTWSADETPYPKRVIRLRMPAERGSTAAQDRVQHFQVWASSCEQSGSDAPRRR